MVRQEARLRPRVFFGRVDLTGGQYFLREIRGPLDNLNLEFPTSKAEKMAEHTTLASDATQTTIAAGQ